MIWTYSGSLLGLSLRFSSSQVKFKLRHLHTSAIYTNFHQFPYQFDQFYCVISRSCTRRFQKYIYVEVESQLLFCHLNRAKLEGGCLQGETDKFRELGRRCDGKISQFFARNVLNGLLFRVCWTA